MLRHLLAALVLSAVAFNALAAVPDPRLTEARTLYEGSAFTPPRDLAVWQRRAQQVRQQILVSAGLWPMPVKTPLNAVIHGSIKREGYTVQKVYFQSYPGFYVTGNLYRPTGAGPFPVVLSPHGHWDNGRFFRASDQDVKSGLDHGWEKDPDAARFPIQARCANLAMLGCIVFQYDMVGYADSDAAHFPHRQTWLDVDSQQRSLSVFGLQMWDSIRALDFVLSLPDADPARVACTGASGGGTQTFMLMAVDDRLTCAAPVCMISPGNHQGGCVCENNPLLRLGTDNVEISCVFAPRPFVHPTATGDWTHYYLDHGYPETQAVYRLFGAKDAVHSERFDAPHNYNMRSRQMVYTFLNEQFKLGGASPVLEKKFVPVDPKELSVFDQAHPRPADSVTAEALKQYLQQQQAAQLDELRPKNRRSLRQFQQTLRTALRVMVQPNLPAVLAPATAVPENAPKQAFSVALSRGHDEVKLPADIYTPRQFAGGVTLLISEQGKAAFGTPEHPGALVQALLAKGQRVIAADIHLTGTLRPDKLPVRPNVEFYAGYNRTTLANRVYDIVTLVRLARKTPGVTSVNLIGTGQAGNWCLLARPLATGIGRCIAEARGIDFEKVSSDTDENYLPASLRFGGFWPLAASGEVGPLLLLGSDRAPEWMSDSFQAAGKAELLETQAKMTEQEMADWVAH